LVFVDRAFTILYDENLKNQWSVTDVDGNTHAVIYKKKKKRKIITN